MLWGVWKNSEKCALFGIVLRFRLYRWDYCGCSDGVCSDRGSWVKTALFHLEYKNNKKIFTKK